MVRINPNSLIDYRKCYLPFGEDYDDDDYDDDYDYDDDDDDNNNNNNNNNTMTTEDRNEINLQ
jgi:hypothetical protein